MNLLIVSVDGAAGHQRSCLDGFSDSDTAPTVPSWFPLPFMRTRHGHPDAAIISKNPGILEASRHQNFRVASEAGVLSVAGHIRSAIQLRKNRHLRRPSRSAQELGL